MNDILESIGAVCEFVAVGVQAILDLLGDLLRGKSR